MFFRLPLQMFYNKYERFIFTFYFVSIGISALGKVSPFAQNVFDVLNEFVEIILLYFCMIAIMDIMGIIGKKMFTFVDWLDVITDDYDPDQSSDAMSDVTSDDPESDFPSTGSDLEPEYMNVLRYWFSLDSADWFSPAPDRYIYDNFQHLHQRIAEGHYGDWKQTAHGFFTHILVLDQFSRNFVRVITNNMNPEYANLYYKKTQNDHLALTYALNLLDNSDYMSQLDWYQKLFVLLPLRHSGVLVHSTRVMSLLDTWRNDIMTTSDEKLHTFFTKFCRAAQNEVTKLEANERIRPIEHDTIPANVFNNMDFTDILDPRVPFKSHESESFESQTEQLIHKSDSLSRMAVYKTLKTYFLTKFRQNASNTRVIVSLSGGVDSMVILYVLNQMAKYDPEMAWMNVVAVHVEFQNRDESSPEAVFLIRWCQMLQVELFYHYVHNAKREHGVMTSGMRADYEERTRVIRFDLYKKAMNASIGTGTIGVVMGHHLDDVIENVLFNIMKARGIYRLEGMSVESVQDQVTILRPLLPLRKSENYTVSDSHHIPYFNNSTPSWSNRGRFREEVLPLLESVWGAQIHQNLVIAGRQSTELAEMLDGVISTFDLHQDEMSAGFKLIGRHAQMVWEYLFTTRLHIPQRTFLQLWMKAYTKYSLTGLKQQYTWGDYKITLDRGEALIVH
jgi:tRNA(Ile)-lysidine synthetase-like protein